MLFPNPIFITPPDYFTIRLTIMLVYSIYEMNCAKPHTLRNKYKPLVVSYDPASLCRVVCFIKCCVQYRRPAYRTASVVNLCTPCCTVSLSLVDTLHCAGLGKSGSASLVTRIHPCFCSTTSQTG